MVSLAFRMCGGWSALSGLQHGQTSKATGDRISSVSGLIMRNAEAVSGGRVSVPRAGMDTSGVLRALTPLRALSLSHLCTSPRGVLWGARG